MGEKLTRPLSVVHTDQEALTALLSVHAPRAARILDVTFNRGRMWRGLPYQPHRMDVDPRHELDTVGDFRSMPFPDFSFDVVVIDPPHVTEAGSGIVGASSWADTYGTRTPGLDGASIAGLFPGFLTEAQRVLVPGGIVLAKIADQVHRGAYRWQHMDFLLAAVAVGMTPCDLIVKVRSSAIVDPKWIRVFHVRKVHSFWLCVRNSRHCMRRGA